MTTTAKTIDASELLDDLPDPNPAIVREMDKPAEPETAPVPETPASPPRVDLKGNAFDPSRHIEKMHPVSGVWMPKKRGKAKPAEPEAASRSFIPDAEAEVYEGPKPEESGEAAGFRAAAEAASSIVFSLGMAVFGEEWKPTPGEVLAQREAWEGYLRSKGARDIPPGLALCIALSTYAGPRLSRPKTLGRLQQFKLWFANWRAKREGGLQARHLRKTEAAANRVSADQAQARAVHLSPNR